MEDVIDLCAPAVAQLNVSLLPLIGSVAGLECVALSAAVTVQVGQVSVPALKVLLIVPLILSPGLTLTGVLNRLFSAGAAVPTGNTPRSDKVLVPSQYWLRNRCRA
jgi:hypothetical protein